jgi:transposase
MLTMNFTYRIYPDASQQAQMLAWLESCRRLYNYALRELKDWMNSRKCMVDRCSLEKEYIISADAPFPGYMEQKRQLPVLKETWTGLKDVHSQVLQDGIKRLKFFKTLQSRLKVLQRRAARKLHRSKNWEKAQIEVAKLHHHIANRRKDFHLKNAHKLCDQAQTIFAVSEAGARLRATNLNTIGLNRGMLGKECVDASFGAFLSLLEWVCWKRGVYFEKVNPNGTSQTCPNCQAAVCKTLEDRVHNCPECQYRTHRDHAAAQMVLIRGLENVVPVDNGEWKPPGHAVLSGAFCLDKWLSRNAQERS